MKAEHKLKILYPVLLETVEHYIEQKKNAGYRAETECIEDAQSWAIQKNEEVQYICVYEHDGEGFLIANSDICCFTGLELDQIIWENLKLALPFRSTIDENRQVITLYWSKIDKLNTEYISWVLENHLSYSNVLRQFLIEKYSI